MGDLDRRIAKLEEQFENPGEAKQPGEEHEKQQWLARARCQRNHSMPKDVFHARDLIGLFRLQNILHKMSADELVERILGWKPVPEGGRSRTAAEMEVARAIHNREEGTEDMTCPPRWRESFVAGDELRERYTAISDEVLAEGDAIALEGFGISDGLLVRALGPDADQLTKEECSWRIGEHLADAFFGEKGYRVQQHRARLA